jgi:hypothetical protein
MWVSIDNSKSIPLFCLIMWVCFLLVFFKWVSIDNSKSIPLFVDNVGVFLVSLFHVGYRR